MCKVMMYLHNKCLSFMPNIFSMYTYSSSHFGMMMSYDVTGGGPLEAPLEAPIVELSVPALKLITLKYKSSTLFGCCTVTAITIVIMSSS